MERYTPTPEPFIHASSDEEVELGAEFDMDMTTDQGAPIY